MTIRPATSDDVPWLLDTAAEAYAVEVPGFDRAGAERWIRACLVDPDTVVLRGTHTAAFAQVVRPPWDPMQPCMDLVHLYGGRGDGEPWECVQVVAALDVIRKKRGCARMYIGSIYQDLEPIARRLGARRLGSLHVLEG
jgi:hypothetical protein